MVQSRLLPVAVRRRCTRGDAFRNAQRIVGTFELSTDPTRRFADAEDAGFHLEQPPNLRLAEVPEAGKFLRSEMPLACEAGHRGSQVPPSGLRHRRVGDLLNRSWIEVPHES